MTRATLEGLADLAKREDLPLYIHLNEARGHAVHGGTTMAAFGGSYVEYLKQCNFLRPEDQPRALGVDHGRGGGHPRRDRSTAALCPVGNPEDAFGCRAVPAAVRGRRQYRARLRQLQLFGRPDMFQAMKMFCSLAAVSDPTPGPPAAADAMPRRVSGRSQAAGPERTTGRDQARLTRRSELLDLSFPSFVPMNSAARQVVFTETGAAVRTVIVDGEVVVENGRMTTIDEAALRAEIVDLMDELTYDAAQVAERYAPIRAAIVEASRRSWEHELSINRYIGFSPPGSGRA